MRSALRMTTSASRPGTMLPQLRSMPLARAGTSVAMPTIDKPEVLELLQSKADRRTREPVALRKLTLRRKEIVRFQFVLNPILEDVNKLIVEWLFH